MRERAKRQFAVWFREIKKQYKIEKQHLENRGIPEDKFYEMAWLMDGMSKYYNPFQEKKDNK